MSETKIHVPGRLKNIAVGGHIAGVEDIYDDSLQQTQKQINDDTYRKSETYNQIELNNLIRTPDVKYVVVDSYAELPSPGEADTVYRVSKYDGEETDNTKYCEYAWDGSQYILLAVKDYGTVETDNIEDSAVTNTKIADSSVTASKIASNAVSASKIIDGAVELAKLDSEVYSMLNIQLVWTSSGGTITSDISSSEIYEAPSAKMNVIAVLDDVHTFTLNYASNNSCIFSGIVDGAVVRYELAGTTVTKIAANIIPSNTDLYTCSTAASTASKTVSASLYSLISGGSIKIKFENANSAASPTLNINSKGAKAIVYNGAAASASNTWAAGDVVEFYYDPTYNSNAGGFIGRSTIVSVSQNTETGKEELLIGGTPALIVDNVPEAGSDNLVKSCGTYEYISSIGRVFMHKAPYKSADLNTFDVYSLKPNTVYEITPSFNVIPDTDIDTDWIINVVEYYNNETTSIRKVLKQAAGRDCNRFYFFTSPQFDFVRIGLRGSSEYSITISEISNDDKSYFINHDASDNANIETPIFYPAKANEVIDFEITSELESPYTGGSNALYIGYYTSDRSSTQLKSLYNVDIVYNKFSITLPNVANIVAVYIKTVALNGFQSTIKISKQYFTEKDAYYENNILPVNARLDSNSELANNPTVSLWGSFQSGVLSLQSDGSIKVACSTGTSYPGIRTNFALQDGKKIRLKVKYKSEASTNIRLYFSGSVLYELPISNEWNIFELNDITVNSFDRIQFCYASSDFSSTASFYLKDISISYCTSDSVQDSIAQLKGLTNDSLFPDYLVNNYELKPFSIVKNHAIKQDGTWNSSTTQFDVWQFIVKPNMKYKFSGRMYGPYTSYFINWYDKNGQFVSHEYKAVNNAENKYVDVVITAPATASFMYMNVLHDDVSYYAVKGLPCTDAYQVSYPNYIGKKISILGDSISTAQDNNAVQFTVLASDIENNRTLQAYPTFYDIGKVIGETTVASNMVGVLTTFTPVSGDEGKTIGEPNNYNNLTQEHIWWYIMAQAIGADILQNVSWSGSSMSSHESSTERFKTSWAWHDAQIAKLATRDSDGNTVTPDVVIIYRGTNDMTHQDYALLTNFGASATSIPDTDIVTGGFGFKEAYAKTIQKIRTAYPMAEIICCTLNVFKRIAYDHWPTRNGINTLPEYNNAIREIANMMGCKIIEFDKDGITFENCYPTYISDDATHPTHPNATGHAKMAEKAIYDILK